MDAWAPWPERLHAFEPHHCQKIYNSVPPATARLCEEVLEVWNAKEIGKLKEGGPKKRCSISLIERVILSAGAMLIFSVSFQIDQMPVGG